MKKTEERIIELEQSIFALQIMRIVYDNSVELSGGFANEIYDALNSNIDACNEFINNLKKNERSLK